MYFVAFIFVSLLTPTLSIEPITTAASVGVAAVAAGAFASFYENIKCSLFECCQKPWFEPNITGMKVALEQKLYGQHLVINSVVKSIQSHLTHPPQKALVLSFHGTTGTGKNYVSNIIAKHLFKKGMDSQYVHLFISTLHFQHESKLDEYTDQLQNWIRGNVSLCAQSLFIFDEIDKMQEGIIDAIKPFLDYYPNVNGVDYRNAIFVFLSNTGGKAITEATLKHFESEKPREQLRLNEVEYLVTRGAYNEEGGLWHSRLIDSHLINIFVPFLPLERRHVLACIEDALRLKGYPTDSNYIDLVAAEVLYFPKDKDYFARAGCKRISEKIGFVMHRDD